MVPQPGAADRAGSRGRLGAPGQDYAGANPLHSSPGVASKAFKLTAKTVVVSSDCVAHNEIQPEHTDVG